VANDLILLILRLCALLFIVRVLAGFWVLFFVRVLVGLWILGAFWLAFEY